MVAFLLSAIVSSALAPVSDSSAQTITVENAATGYYVSVTSPDTVELEVDATPVGQTVVSSANTVNVKTNAPLGYKLYLSTENDELTATDSSITQTFKPVSSTSLTDNTWGFSTDSSDIKNWLAVPEATSGNESSGYLLSSSATANIPDGTNIDVYYGINADTTMPSGTYSTTVTYTAISESVIEYPTMQDFTLHDCANLTIGTSTTLKDIRNGANYRITRLADGNCWMTENLRLDGGINLTSDNTNLPSGTSIYLPENITEGTTSNSTDLQIIRNKESYDGNLYNWCAATLNNTNCSTTTTEATQDICPKGWRLPSNTGTPSYSNLFSLGGVTNYTTAEASPYYFTRAGTYGNGSYNVQGLGANYWSRTPNTTYASGAYEFTYYSTDGRFQPSNWVDKSLGGPLRCAMQLGGTMQSFTATDCQTLELEKSTLLVDTRDNKVYRAARLKDGNCWMIDNLAIYNQKISSTDSDLPSGTTITLPASTTWSTNITNAMKIHVANGTGSYADKTGAYNGLVYYNWCASLGKSSCAESSGTFNQSICPKGWRLPINGGATVNKTWAKLMNVYGISRGTQLLAQPVLGFEKLYGYWDWRDASEASQGASGNFWSSTPASDAYAYYLYSNSGTVNPQFAYYKGFGFNIRCILR